MFDILPDKFPTAATSHMTILPSTAVVATLLISPGDPSYGRTLVMVFWCTVSNSDSSRPPPLAGVVGLPGRPGVPDCPLTSAFLNVLKAALFSLPTPPLQARPGKLPGPPTFGVDASSSDPTADHPLSEPLYKTGWQSWPAATKASSAVQVSVTWGRVELLMLMMYGPEGYTIVTEESWPV
jgi:hypothetical protein